MRLTLALTLSSLWLAGCGVTLPVATGTVAATTVSATADVAARSGLSADVAARPSVQLSRPLAYALTPEARPFLNALATTVAPQREALAARLKEDTTVTAGLAAWDRSTSSAKLAVLQRVAAIQGEVMNCQVPAIQLKTGATPSTGLMAVYQPALLGNGTITVYGETLSQKSKYVAVSVMVHEVRHAAQYQLFTGNRSLSADEQVLADAFEESWTAADAAGGESELSYGDYVHLNVEYDAFQTGNQVAALLSGTAFQVTGIGFVDVQYNAQATPIYDVLTLGAGMSGTALITAVNQAQYQAERSAGGSITRQRTGGDFQRPTGWSRRGR